MISQSLLQETVDALTIKRAALGDKKRRHISPDGSINEIQIGCNIHQLPQLVNAKFAPNTTGDGTLSSSVKPIHEHGVYSLRAVNPINIKF